MSTHPIIMSESMQFGSEFMSQDLQKGRDMTLSGSLPSHERDFMAVDDGHDSTPFEIHSSVLDSVFSNVLDDNEQLQDHTPMFDDLDFAIDGAKVNTKEDWVALFNSEDHEPVKQEFEEDLLAGIPKEELADSSIFAKIEEEERMAAEKREASKKRLFETFENGQLEKGATQLFTPNPSLTLPTPLLDGAKEKKDRYGCVSYSKKQRTQPLPPVDTKTDDPVLMKRAKNTEAARRSRARKMERMTQLEAKVEELLKDKESLELEVSRLRAMLKAQGVAL